MKRIARFLSQRGFADKQHTQGVSAAMGGDGTACPGHQHLFEGCQRLDLLYTLFDDRFVTACVGHKDSVRIDISPVADPMTGPSLPPKRFEPAKFVLFSSSCNTM